MTADQLAEVEKNLIEDGMRYVYGDVRKAMQECYRTVMPNLIGGSPEVVEEAFRKMFASLNY